MIVTLTGTVSAISTDALVLEVGGVGYRVFAGPRTLSQARVGAHQHLHTHHLVREDLQALYGFRSAEELVDFFRVSYGPTLKAFAALDGAGRYALELDLIALAQRFDRLGGDAVAIPAAYTEAVAIRN